MSDYERTNATSARDPFTQSTINVPSGNWNEFGGTFGGPIRKNKAFIFGDYQGTRSHVGGSAQDRIMTAAEKGGDLSDLGVNIYDPWMTTDSTHQTLLLDASGNPIPVPVADRTQFPNNIIPQSRLSDQAQKLLALYPSGATGLGLNPNFFGSGSNLLNEDGFDVRGDTYASDKLHLFGRYSLQKYTRAGPGLFGDVLGGNALPSDPSVGNFAGSSNVKNQSLASGFDYTLSPTLITDFRFGYLRYHVHTEPGGFGSSPASDAGIPGLNIDQTYTTGMPAFNINSPGTQTFQFGYSLGVNQCNCPLTESEHQYQFVNNWTNIRGSHSIKFGADIRYAYNLRVPSDAHRAGELSFNNDNTEGPGGVGGSGYAGFLLGDVSSFNRYVSTSTNAYETQPRLFFYGQDTWRMTPKLTFNYGLRWEIYRPESVAGTGEGGWLDPSTGEIRVAGQNGVNLMGNTSTDYKHFAPRLGFAYQLNPKTVVRVGYGRSFDIGVFGTIFGHTVTQNLPVLAQQSINVASGDTAFLLSQGPPSFDTTTALTVNNCNAITDPTGTKTECLGPNGDPLLPNNVYARARPFDNRLPTVDAWNASVQRQLTQSIGLTVSYVANKGTHTLLADNPAYGINNPTEVGYNPNGGLSRNQRLPYYSLYGWTQGICWFGNDASNKYNSLQTVLEKRFSGGLSFQASYTFQHADYYANDGYYNIQHIEYGPNANYRDSVFIFTEVYQLPIGKGKRWGSSMSRVADAAIGGWQLNSATNFSSGLPFTPGISTCSPSIDNGPCKPNISGSVASGTRSGDPEAAGYWFETTNGVSIGSAGASAGPYSQPALDTFGNAAYNGFRGPKLFNTDLSLFKNFKITEKASAELQIQSFNVFNHVNLNLPNGCVDCGNGGNITDIAYGSQMRTWQFGLKVSF